MKIPALAIFRLQVQKLKTQQQLYSNVGKLSFNNPKKE
jgi:hypothetical protein